MTQSELLLTVFLVLLDKDLMLEQSFEKFFEIFNDGISVFTCDTVLHSVSSLITNLPLSLRGLIYESGFFKVTIVKVF